MSDAWKEAERKPRLCHTVMYIRFFSCLLCTLGVCELFRTRLGTIGTVSVRINKPIPSICAYKLVFFSSQPRKMTYRVFSVGTCDMFFSPFLHFALEELFWFCLFIYLLTYLCLGVCRFMSSVPEGNPQATSTLHKPVCVLCRFHLYDFCPPRMVSASKSATHINLQLEMKTNQTRSLSCTFHVWKLLAIS